MMKPEMIRNSNRDYTLENNENNDNNVDYNFYNENKLQ